MDYFVITTSDGESYVRKLSKDELVKRLNEDYYDDDWLTAKALKSEPCLSYGSGCLIIKGELVKVIPPKRVTKPEVP